MIWLWVKHNPLLHGDGQYTCFYQLHYPELKGGMYLHEIGAWIDNP